MREIPLTQGKVTKVDDVDYDFLMQWEWYAKRVGNSWYAVRDASDSEFLEMGKRVIYMHEEIGRRMLETN